MVWDVGDQKRRGAKDPDCREVAVLALLRHRDEAAERLADPDVPGVADRRDPGGEVALEHASSYELEDGMRRIGRDRKRHEVAVVRAAAVTPAQVVAGDENVAAPGVPLGLAVARASGRLQIPVPAVIGATGDRHDHPRISCEPIRIGHDRQTDLDCFVNPGRECSAHVDAQVVPEGGHFRPPLS